MDEWFSPLTGRFECGKLAGGNFECRFLREHGHVENEIQPSSDGVTIYFGLYDRQINSFVPDVSFPLRQKNEPIVWVEADDLFRRIYIEEDIGGERKGALRMLGALLKGGHRG